MKNINTYKLCESKLLSAPICSLQSEEVKPQGARTTCQQDEKKHTYLKMIKSIKNQDLSVRKKI
jgi:hypothetical protein